MNITVNYKKLSNQAIVPTRGSACAAGYDLYACPTGHDALFIAPGATVMVGTGLAMEIPFGYVGLIYARSGLACKRGLAPANKVGVIDSDYRGELIVALHNDSSEEQCVMYGDRIAQLIIQPYYACNMIEVKELSSTNRGEGGFGSTGVSL